MATLDEILKLVLSSQVPNSKKYRVIHQLTMALRTAATGVLDTVQKRIHDREQGHWPTIVHGLSYVLTHIPNERDPPVFAGPYEFPSGDDVDPASIVLEFYWTGVTLSPTQVTKFSR